jgi:RNA-binding protein
MAPIASQGLIRYFADRAMEDLTNPQIRKLKALAQRMDATLKIGKHGLSDAFIHSLNEELDRHELVKVKFTEFKEQKKELAPQLATRTNSHLVTLLGNVAVLFRRNPDAQKQKIRF